MKLLPHIKQGNVVHFLRSPTMSVTVMENQHYRWLTFDNTVQSIMLKRIPHKLPLPHQTALCLPLLWYSPQQVVELGLGGGNLLRFIQQVNRHSQLISVEPEPEVIKIFQQFFNPNSCDVTLVNNTAQHFLHSATMKTSDWLICDAYPDITALTEVLAILPYNAQLKVISINLPNFPEEKIEQVLAQLAQWKDSYHIRYFEVPHYTNIIIHLVVKSLNISAVIKSNLPHYQQKRWQQLWQYGKQL